MYNRWHEIISLLFDQTADCFVMVKSEGYSTCNCFVLHSLMMLMIISFDSFHGCISWNFCDCPKSRLSHAVYLIFVHIRCTVLITSWKRSYWMIFVNILRVSFAVVLVTNCGKIVPMRYCVQLNPFIMFTALVRSTKASSQTAER